MACEKIEYLVGIPARIPKFDHVALSGWQCGQETRQSLDIDAPVRRQLVEHRSQVVTQNANARVQPFEWLFGVLQFLLCVRNLLALTA